jgi:hypothetical protein
MKNESLVQNHNFDEFDNMDDKKYWMLKIQKVGEFDFALDLHHHPNFGEKFFIDNTKNMHRSLGLSNTNPFEMNKRE